MMIRPLVTAALIVTLAFAAVIDGMRLLPDDNPALAVLGRCAETLCWRGIQPGVTPDGEAITRLSERRDLITEQSRNCYTVPGCTVYKWTDTNTRALYATVEMRDEHAAAINAFLPGFNLGQALLALDDLPINGGDLDVGVADQFHIGLHVAGSSLVLRAITPCPSSYRAMLSMPVSILELQALAPGQQQFPMPTLDYSTFRRAFDRVCGSV